METKPEIEDIDLIKKIKNESCNDSLVKLINRYEYLCLDAYKKFYPVIKSSGVSFEDIYGEKDYLIWKTANSFKEDKNSKYSTWLCNNIRFQCLNAINKHVKQPICVDINSIDYTNELKQLEKDRNNEYINSEANYIETIINQFQDKRMIEIFKMRIYETGKNAKWKEISKKMKLSIPACIAIYKKGLAILKKKMNSKNCFDKI